MVGVNSGDGRGNITAYATVFDSKQVLQRDRDYSACSLDPNPDGLLRLRRFLGRRGRIVHGLRDLLLHGRYRGRLPQFRPATRPLQLRSAEPLPASGAPLQHRCDGSLRVRRTRRRVHPADVQRLRVDRPDRPGRQLLQLVDHQLRQPVPAGRQPGDIGCDAAASRGRHRSPCTSGGATWKAAGGSRSFANNSFRAVAGVRGAINDGWGYDVSAQYSSVSANTGTQNYFVMSRIVRALDVVDVGGVPTCQSVIDGTDPNCVPWNPFQPGGVDRTSSTTCRPTGCRSAASTRRSTTRRSTVTSGCTASSRRSPPTASRWCSAPSGAATP